MIFLKILKRWIPFDGRFLGKYGGWPVSRYFCLSVYNSRAIQYYWDFGGGANNLRLSLYPNFDANLNLYYFNILWPWNGCKIFKRCVDRGCTTRVFIENSYAVLGCTPDRKFWKKKSEKSIMGQNSSPK